MSTEVVEVVHELVQVVEVAQVTGPAGTVTPQLVQELVDQVVDELNDGPDLSLLYANAKA